MDFSSLSEDLAKTQSSLDALQSQVATKNSLISKLETDIQRLNDLQTRSTQSPVSHPQMTTKTHI